MTFDELKALPKPATPNGRAMRAAQMAIALCREHEVLHEHISDQDGAALLYEGYRLLAGLPE